MQTSECPAPNNLVAIKPYFPDSNVKGTGKEALIFSSQSV